MALRCLIGISWYKAAVERVTLHLGRYRCPERPLRSRYHQLRTPPVRSADLCYTVGVATSAPALRMSSNFRLQRVRDVHPGVLSKMGQDGTPGDYGILWPSTAENTLKLISPELADYLEHLAGGGRELDSLIALGSAGDCLLFDGVVERMNEGAWFSGPLAVPGRPEASIDLGDAGIGALLDARRRIDLTPTGLYRFLYEYGRRPFSPRWVAAIGGSSPEALSAWYGLNEQPHLRRIIQLWRARRSDEWWHWQNPTPRSSGSGVTWKLYVNVEPSALPVALASVAEVLVHGDAAAFKVAGNARAALRPDKLVIYFGHREDLEEAGEVLSECLGRVRPHPLPFTAPLRGSPLVTWGIDPPKRDVMAQGSWRSWLCSTAAGVVWALRPCQSEGQFLERLSARMLADGIVTHDWMPAGALMHQWGADPDSLVRPGTA